MNLFTWNMQGSNASTEQKWYTGILNMMTQLQAPIACLQECGPLPPSASLYAAALDGNANFHCYLWNNKFISFYWWDVAGNRVNLAIVTNAVPTAWLCRVPAAAPVWRPVIGVQIGGVWYNCLHAISPGGADAPALLAAAAAAAGAATWFTAGDFNRAPLPALPTGNVCVPNGPTYPTAKPVSSYDHAYTSAAATVGQRADGMITSDHIPVFYDAP